MTPRSPQEAPRSPHDHPKTPKIGPKRPQDRPKIALRRPRSAPDRPKRRQDRPKMPQERSKSALGTIWESSCGMLEPSWDQKCVFFVPFFNTFCKFEFLPQHRFRRHLGTQYAPTWGVKSGQERPKSGPRRTQEQPRAAYISHQLEAPTNPVREENRTTAGNPNVDYQHELIMNALRAIALLCFAWQLVGLLFYIFAMPLYV